MAVFSTVSSKGQITIPLEIRNRLGLNEGDRVEFFSEQGQTIMRPARASTNPFAEFVGVLGEFKNRTDINQWIADLRDEERTA